MPPMAAGPLYASCFDLGKAEIVRQMLTSIDSVVSGVHPANSVGRTSYKSEPRVIDIFSTLPFAGFDLR